MKSAADTPTIRLPQALTGLPPRELESALRKEIEALDPALLPLQQGLTYGSHALGDDLSVIIIKVTQSPGQIRVKAGIQYHGIIAGCSCADDPSPVDRTNEYCELLLEIDTDTAATTITLVES